MTMIGGVVHEIPKCGHALAAKSETCMYCGVPRQGPGPGPAITGKSKWRHFAQSEEQKLKKGLSEHPRHEDASGKRDDAVIAKANRDALPLQKVLALLSGLRDSYNRGDIDYDVYEQMAAGIIKDCVTALDDDVRIGFVLNEITDSDLSDYLTDDILRDLRALVLASIA
jgi:hypothetical protein